MSTVMSHLQSEFGYDALFKQNGMETIDIRYKYTTFAVWMLLVFFIPILMSNLLVRLCDCLFSITKCYIVSCGMTGGAYRLVLLWRTLRAKHDWLLSRNLLSR